MRPIVRLPATGLAVALATLATFALAGCGAGAGAQGQQAPAATVAPSPTAIPPDVPIPAAFIGTWKADRSTGTQSHGTWTLRITSDDMELLNPIATSDADFFTLHPRGATPTDISFYADPDCLGASYHWRVDGDALTFTSDHADSCIDRYSTLTGEPWHRASAASSAPSSAASARPSAPASPSSS
jgi:hypothetical protein